MNPLVFTIDVSVILNSLIIGLLGVLGWAGKNYLQFIKKSSEQTVAHLQTLNGRVTKLEVQVIEHNKFDDERFANVERLLRDVTHTHGGRAQ